MDPTTPPHDRSSPPRAPGTDPPQAGPGIDPPQTGPGADPPQAGPGTDPPAARPGVPMEATSSDGGGRLPIPRQANAGDHLVRAGLDRPTPVVGTAQRPHGLSGLLRRRAYAIPEHYARHWSLLLLADRVDVLEDRLGGAMARPLQRIGLEQEARRVRSNPLPVLAGALVGAWLARRVLS